MDFLKELENLKKKINLNRSIKEGFRSRLVDHVLAGTDVREAELFRHSMQRSNILNFLQYKFMPIFLIIAIMVSAGGGVSLAAEQALPGDILYPIKVNLNEKVVDALSFSADAKANWEVRLAERRLEEAGDLVAKGKINEDTEASIKSNFAEQAQRVAQRIAEIEAKGNVRNASEIASRFETSLRVHQNILEKLELSTSSETSAQVGRIKIKVDSEFEKTKESRERLESQVEKEDGKPETKQAAEGKINAAENVISSVREKLNRNEEGFSTSVVSSTEAKVKAAEEILVSAKAKLDAGAYGEAFILAQSSLRAAQEARGAIDVSAEVRSAISHGEDDGEDERDEIKNNSSSQDDDNKDEIEVEVESRGENDSGKINSSGSLRVKVGL